MNKNLNNLLSNLTNTFAKTHTTFILLIVFIFLATIRNISWYVTYIQAMAISDQSVLIPWTFVVITSLEVIALVCMIAVLSLTSYAEAADKKLSTYLATQITIALLAILILSTSIIQDTQATIAIENLCKYLLLFIIFLFYKQRHYWRDIVAISMIIIAVIADKISVHLKNTIIIMTITLGLAIVAFWGVRNYASYGDYDYRFWEGLSSAREFYANDSDPRDKQCAEEYLKAATKTTVGKSGFMHKTNVDPTGCLNIEEEGLRHTWQPPQPATTKKFVIWVLGGSTIYSGYTADDRTIPSYLAKFLFAAGMANIKVVNLGITTYNAIQSRLRFEQALIWNIRDQPDLVIFYEGVNEIMSATENLSATQINNYPSLNFFYNHLMANLIEQNRKPEAVFNRLVDLILQETWRTAVARFKFEHHIPQKSTNNNQTIPHEISQSIGKQAHEAYLANMRYVENTAKRLDIPVIFILQPHAFSKNVWGRLEKQNVEPYQYLSPVFSAYYHLAKESIATGKYANWIDLSDIFRDEHHDLFFDWCHCRASANKLIGNRIGEYLVLKDLIKRQ